jgi:hypothetical protein
VKIVAAPAQERRIAHRGCPGPDVDDTVANGLGERQRADGMPGRGEWGLGNDISVECCLEDRS